MAVVRFLVFFILLLSSSISFSADVKALFHPYDATLEEVAKTFEQAQSTIDMAFYNIDATSKSPVIRWLQKESVQARIQSKKLQVRLIFEGYGSPESDNKKMAAFEKLGVDTKTLGSGKKMHHKFAVIDGNTANARLITGSANWSLGSRNNYNENILYIKNQQNLAVKFQKEYNFLWRQAKEVGMSKAYPIPFYTYAAGSVVGSDIARPAVGIDAFFNTDNFVLTKKGLRKKKGPGYVLTRKIVEGIDKAESHIEIATTRMSLRPVYNAILRAAKRNVKIDIVVSMQSYVSKDYRGGVKMKDCDDEYKRTCSTSQNFALFLEEKNYPGKENVRVRIKQFNVTNKGQKYLKKQMHSKYMIVDSQTLYSGSFNWSYSAEYNHIENLVVARSSHFPEVLQQYAMDFDRLWNLNRNQRHGLMYDFFVEMQNNAKLQCAFEPIVMSYKEIDLLLGVGKRTGHGELSDHCLE